MLVHLRLCAQAFVLDIIVKQTKLFDPKTQTTKKTTAHFSSQSSSDKLQLEKLVVSQCRCLAFLDAASP